MNPADYDLAPVQIRTALHAWIKAYAQANRMRMADVVAEAMRSLGYEPPARVLPGQVSIEK